MQQSWDCLYLYVWLCLGPPHAAKVYHRGERQQLFDSRLGQQTIPLTQAESVREDLRGINQQDHCTRMHSQPRFSFGKLDEERCPQDLLIAFVVAAEFFVDHDNIFPLPVICLLIPAPQDCCSGVIMPHLR